MDAECARADLENLRLAVWEKVKPAPAKPKFSLHIRSLLRPLVIAAIAAPLVCSATARDIVPPDTALKASSATVGDIENSLAKSTAKAAEVAPNLDAEPVLIAANVPQKASIPAKPQEVSKKSTRRVSQSAPQAKRKPASLEPAKSKPAKSVAYDKVFSLMQTGQRALKNNNSVVKVK